MRALPTRIPQKTQSVSTLPLVTVILPNFNGARYLARSMKSVLRQSFRHFELIVIDDGSTDRSLEIIRSFKDERINLIAKTTHRGLVPCLNEAIAAARGKYIARMDADDVCLRSRLKRQVAFLERHPRTDACGSWIVSFGHHYAVWKGDKLPLSDSGIKLRLLFGNPLANPTVVFRKDFFQNGKLLYDPRFINIEDYEIWSRAFDHVRLGNIPRVLLKYRYHSLNTSHNKAHLDKAKRKDKLIDIYKKLFDHYHIKYSRTDLELHYRANDYTASGDLDLRDVSRWLDKLATGLAPYFKKRTLDRIFLYQWFFYCRSFSGDRWPVRRFLRSPFFKLNVVGIKYFCFLLCKSLFLACAGPFRSLMLFAARRPVA